MRDEDDNSAPQGSSEPRYDTNDFEYGDGFQIGRDGGRGRGIDGARPAGPTGMYYDQTQQALQDLLRENDVAIDDAQRQAAKLAAELRKRMAAGDFTITIVGGWMGVDPEQDENHYRPSLLIDCLVPSARAQDMHANLEDMYPHWVERHGPAKARWINRLQIGRMVGGEWLGKLLTVAERLLKVTRLSG